MLLAILVVLVLFGVRFVNRMGLVIISFVFVSILAIVIGLLTSSARSDTLLSEVKGLNGLDSQNFSDNWSSSNEKYSFFTLHAIFFNACTGILSGANSSHNLKNPI